MSTSPSTTSSAFEQAVILNNQGVQALCDNDEESAIAVLTSSVRLMKSELSKPDVNLSSSQRDCSSSPFELVPAKLVELPKVSCDSPPQQQQCIDDDEDEQALFSRAFSIPLPTSDDAQLTSEQDVHIYSAAIVFNLALAYQRLASRHKQDRKLQVGFESSLSLYSVNRNKAEKLYTVILRLLQDNACYQARTCVMLQLAAIHNLHWIQYQKREQEYAPCDNGTVPSLVQALSRFVQDLRQQDPNLARSYLENDAQIQGLLMNVLWLKDQQVPKIAPAA